MVKFLPTKTDHSLTPVPSEEEKQVDKGRKALLLRTPIPSEEEKQVDKGREALLLRTPIPSEEEKQR